MATVRTRQNRTAAATFQVRWLDSKTGRYRSLLYADEAEAKRFAAILTDCHHDLMRAQSLTKAVKTGAKGARHVLDDVADRHITARGCRASERVLGDYRAVYDRHISPVLGRIPVEAITRDMVADWIDGLRTSTGAAMADHTVNNVHCLLSGIFKTAIKLGWTAANPAQSQRLPRTPGNPDTEPVFLTAADFWLIHDAMKPAQRPLLELLAGTGCRWGEAIALRVGDVDLRAEVPSVRISKAIVQDLGRKMLVGPTKTKKGNRTVTVGPHLATTLAALVAGRGRGELLFRPLSPLAVAVNHSTWHADYWTPAVTAASDVKKHGAAALPRRPRIHDLRHSHASWLIAEQMGFKELQERLGHESITTTMDRYGHLDPNAGARGAAAIGRALAR